MMAKQSERLSKWILGVGFLTLAGLTVSIAAEKPAFTRKQKAFYLNEQELAFIRPGLTLKVLDGSIDNTGTVRFRFTITDPRGLPLDIDGIFTPGPVSIRPVIAYIPRDQREFRSYIERMVTSSITGQTATQAERDRNGSIEKVGEGEYIYTFGAKVPTNFDRAVTHRIAVWALRDLEEFELGEESDVDVFDFVPAGGEVTVVREIVSDAACNQCHGDLSAHDQRKEVALCITCHNPQSTDPDTGNTVDFKVMIHKIHMGEELPSVQAGGSYQIIGFGGSVHDYSEVVFPADARRCQVCHQGSSQANNYLTKPSRQTCGSCHDNVNFATGENHADLPQVSDSQCANCHIPEGELEFDLSVVGAHTVPVDSKELPGTNFEILNIQNTGPGQTPTVTFSIKEDDGDPILPSEVSRLTIYLAGNTTDISRYISEGASSAQGSGGVYTYTFQQPIPEDAVGSWRVAIEGQRVITLLEGTRRERTANDAGDNPVMAFAVTDTEPVPRRKVVSLEKCNQCHFELALHGGPRKNVDLCVVCHNANLTDAAFRPEDQLPPEGINFKMMIHKIHTGHDLEIPFTVYGFRGSEHDFTEVHFPGDRRDCTICHIDGTQQLPLQEGLLSSVTPRDFFNPTPPITGACLSCHTNIAAAAHADLNISPNFGEACAVCHGQEADFSVDRVHAR